MNGIDEILHNIELDDDYSEPLTRAEQKRILSIINNKTGIAPKRKKRHIARTLLIAACVTALLAVTTALAAYFMELEKPLGDMLGVTEENFDEIANAVDAPVCSVTDNGVTVNVLQTLADSRTVYAVFEVIAPENVKMEQWYEFERYHFFPADSYDHPEKYGSFSMDVSVVEADGNRMKCIATADGFTKELPDCEWMLELENIGNFKGAEPNHEWNGYIDGKWTIKWNYSSEKNPETKRVPVNIPLGDGARDISITDITLTPISALFEIEGVLTEDEVTEIQTDDARMLDKFREIDDTACDSNLSVKTNDGIIDWQHGCETSHMGGQDGNLIKYRYYMRFDNIIEMDDIKSVIVNGVEYPIE